MDVLNADPEMSYLNEELVKLDDKTYVEAFNERMKTLGYGEDKKIRSNAVYAFEVVTTFSREDHEKIDLEEWKKIMLNGFGRNLMQIQKKMEIMLYLSCIMLMNPEMYIVMQL